jgi:hypothetical protein
MILNGRGIGNEIHYARINYEIRDYDNVGDYLALAGMN